MWGSPVFRWKFVEGYWMSQALEDMWLGPRLSCRSYLQHVRRKRLICGKVRLMFVAYHVGQTFRQGVAESCLFPRISHVDYFGNLY